MQGEGALGKKNKKKFDLGRSVEDDVDSYMPSAIGPFDEILGKMIEIKELVYKLPQRLGESSTTHRSYVARSDYKIYLKN